MTAAGRVPHQVVSASAGSGKTYQLAVHYLGLLRHGAAPQSIIATTFTRKAAGEILGRVLSRLAVAALGDDPAALATLSRDLDEDLTAAQCRQMLASLARELHRVGIGTIDSFFNRIVHAFSLELGVPAGVRVVAEDDPLAQQLRWQALEAVLADGDLPDLLTLLRRLLKDSAENDVAKQLDAAARNFLAVYQEVPRAECWHVLVPPPGKLSRPELAVAIDGMSQALGTNQQQALADALGSNYSAAARHDWSGFLGQGLAKKINDGDRPFVFGRARTAVPDALVAVYQPLVAHAKAVLIEQVVARGQAAWELLSRFDRHYRRLRRQHRLLLFSDLTTLLAENAPAAADLYYRLDGRVGHLLLDEFQDTSRTQWRVLRPLAQELAAHADGQRSFFCVGDPKQAIYAWRGGCAGLFDELRRDLPLPDDAFTPLDTSYRSAPEILRAVNTVFARVPDDAALQSYPSVADAWRRRFIPHRAHHKNRPGHVVLKTLRPVPRDEGAASPNADVDDAEEGSSPAYLEQVARYVAGLAAKHPGRSLGVLMRTNTDINRLIFLLHDVGLWASGEGGNPLGDDTAVNLLLSAVRLADHPGDGPSAFHVLQSPLAPILGLKSLDRPDLEAVALAVRRRLIDEGYAAVIADWTRQLAPRLDLRNIQRLRQLVELADAYDQRPSLRPDLFARLVRQTRVEEPLPAAVRVMTIHAAKGLEFDAVVLPQLDGSLSKARFSHLVLRDPQGAPTAVFAGASQEICALNPQLDQAYQDARAQQVQDELCALYVAMTRARFALHMLVKPRGKPKEGGTGPDAKCPANILRRALGRDDEKPLGEQTLHESGTSDWHEQEPPPQPAEPAPPIALRLLPPAAPPDARRSWRSIAPSSLENGGRVRVERLLAADDSPAMGRGLLLHAWMRLVEWSDAVAGPPTDQQLVAVARECGRLDAAELAEPIADFRRTLQLPRVIAALRRPPGDVELWRERRFAVRAGGELVNGMFDRVVLHKANGRVQRAELLDFKSDRIGPDTCDLDALVEGYRPQIAAYRRALAALLNLHPDAIAAKLLFLATGACRNV